MNEIRSGRGKAGWSDTERECLWREAQIAAENNLALCSVFESVAEQTGRKPNSIRNYYYASIKEGNAPRDLNCQRAAPFVAFSQEELSWLVREVLKARSCGESVRACVNRLGEGDRAKTLRYQNKYRSVLKLRPDYIRQTMRELSREGVFFGEMFTPVRKRRVYAQGAATPAEEYVARIMAYGKPGIALLEAVCALLGESAACGDAARPL